MGRPKGSTGYSDAKIIWALQYSPRVFSEFELALVKERIKDMGYEETAQVPRLLYSILVKNLRIPRKTLARRLKEMVDKDWVRREVLPVHGHHVRYYLNFEKSEEMSLSLPNPLKVRKEPELEAGDMLDGILDSIEYSELKQNWGCDKKIAKSLNSLNIDIITDALPWLKDYSEEKRVDFFNDLLSGRVCRDCLINGYREKSFHVQERDGMFFCRNCGQEVTVTDQDVVRDLKRMELCKSLEKVLAIHDRFFKAIDKQRGEEKT